MVDDWMAVPGRAPVLRADLLLRGLTDLGETPMPGGSWVRCAGLSGFRASSLERIVGFKRGFWVLSGCRVSCLMLALVGGGIWLSGFSFLDEASLFCQLHSCSYLRLGVALGSEFALSVSGYSGLCARICVYMYAACMYAFMHVCKCMYVCIYVCMYVCVYVCMCVCVYNYIYTYIYMLIYIYLQTNK